MKYRNRKGPVWRELPDPFDPRPLPHEPINLDQPPRLRMRVAIGPVGWWEADLLEVVEEMVDELMGSTLH